MLKFAHITDSHFGLTDKNHVSAYHKQRGYPDQVVALVAALQQLVEREGLSFVLHTGDIIHAYSPEYIALAQNILSTLSVPVYLCLGNHDLWNREQAPSVKDMHAAWQKLAPEYFKDDVNFTLSFNECQLHVLPNQWGQDLYEWTSDQTAGFRPEQVQFIEAALSELPTKTHIIATHAQVQCMDLGQGGTTEAAHKPTPAFAQFFLELKRRFPQLKLVINGHTHINMHRFVEDCHYVCTSSFIEAPFDCKIFTVADDSLQMQTHALGELVDFNWAYDFNATYVQGRLPDRTF